MADLGLLSQIRAHITSDLPGLDKEDNDPTGALRQQRELAEVYKLLEEQSRQQEAQKQRS